MTESAHVESVEAIKAFRIALIKFAEEAQSALVSAESDLTRTQQWLDTQQTPYWQAQIVKRHAAVVYCKDKIREKRLFKNSAGMYPSTHEEEKALKLAIRRFDEAEQKLADTRKYSGRLHREILLYKGQVQRFGTIADVDLPMASAWLNRVIDKLEGYANLAPGDERMADAMRQAVEELPEPPPKEPPLEQANEQSGDKPAVAGHVSKDGASESTNGAAPAA